MSKTRVLYVCNEDRHLGGSSLSLLNMLQALEGSIDPVLLFMSDGVVASFFRKKGYNCLVVPFYRSSFSPAGFIRVVRFLPHAVMRFFKQRICVYRVMRVVGKVDLVHSNSSTVDIGLMLARRMGVPHLWHIREYYDTGLHGRPFPSWASWKRKLFRSDAVVAITPGLFEHWGLENHRNACCIPDAVCSESAALPVLVERKRQVLFIAGSISQLKRPQEALQIFAASGLTDCRLLFVGNVTIKMRQDLTDLASSLWLAGRVEFVPFVDDVMPLLRESAAVLVCTENEGMGRVAVEAMFAGCPVVSGNSGGSRDVLSGNSDGSGGSRDVLAAGALGSLYDSVPHAAALLRAAVESLPLEQLRLAQSRALSLYSTEHYAAKILTVYRSARR